ncbi:hypothetical protein N431DRAFT_432327 [Stipitochalara longipes BDJ]|nr:hypothetical protein N431DRAFT_432327 [Stipitochalara longipes BDJ]
MKAWLDRGWRSQTNALAEVAGCSATATAAGCRLQPALKRDGLTNTISVQNGVCVCV